MSKTHPVLEAGLVFFWIFADNWQEVVWGGVLFGWEGCSVGWQDIEWGWDIP